MASPVGHKSIPIAFQDYFKLRCNLEKVIQLNLTAYDATQPRPVGHITLFVFIVKRSGSELSPIITLAFATVLGFY